MQIWPGTNDSPVDRIHGYTPQPAPPKPPRNWWQAAQTALLAALLIVAWEVGWRVAYAVERAGQRMDELHRAILPFIPK